MAFGGVLIGIIKAQLAASVRGIQSVRTDCSIPKASIAIMPLPIPPSQVAF